MTQKYTFVCRIEETGNDEDIARQRMAEVISHGIKYNEIYDWFDLEKTEPTDDEENDED